MRFASAVLLALSLVACGPADAPVEEAPMTPAAPTLADFAGTWSNSSILTGVADPVASTMTGTADGVWTMSLEGRDAIPMTVTIVGDSLIAETAEYESILRAGVMVTVRTAAVLHDGMLMGNLTATYKTEGVSETVPGTFTGTRVLQ